MRPNLSLVTLGVRDLARSAAFYEEGLGWRRSSASVGDVVFFDLGGVVLALFPRTLLAEDAKLSPEGTGFAGVALAHNTRSPREVEDVLAEAVRAGGTLLKSAAKTEWGGYSGYFADVDGHVWEVAHNPHWPLDERGRIELPT